MKKLLITICLLAMPLRLFGSDVSERTSEADMKRARQIRQHNAEVNKKGDGIIYDIKTGKVEKKIKNNIEVAVYEK